MRYPISPYRQNEFLLDLVVCIDGTASMKPLIDQFRRSAGSLARRLMESLNKKGKGLREGRLRVKTILFRNYNDSAFPAMEVSRFFDLSSPEDVEAFTQATLQLQAAGRGSEPQNAFEAIFEALMSDFSPEGGRYRRQAILLFTDAPAMPPRSEGCVDAPGYPADMPDSLGRLTALYEAGAGMNGYFSPLGRLVACCPNDSSWTGLNAWTHTALNAVRQDGGCAEVSLAEVFDLLAGLL